MIRAVILLYVLARFADRVLRDSHRIGAHIGDQADLAFGSKLNTFVKPLRQSHGALYGEPQLAGDILLEFAGGERSGWIAATFFLLDGANRPGSVLQRLGDLLRLFGVVDFGLLIADAD